MKETGKRILKGLVNWIGMLTVPLWGGVVVGVVLIGEAFGSEYDRKRFKKWSTGQSWLFG